jgi:hypothetical protein
VSFSFRETQIVKGMLDRGDRQHDIASYFGVNGGRIAEISTGNCDYPTAQPCSEDKLPPSGPYVGAKTVFEIKESLLDAVALIEAAGDGGDEARVAIDSLNAAIAKL